MPGTYRDNLYNGRETMERDEIIILDSGIDMDEIASSGKCCVASQAAVR